ncbi:MAG: hypothetical protein ABFD76_04585 [Smithella sp.]
MDAFEFGKRKIIKDFDMRTVRAVNGYLLDECYFFQNVLLVILFMQTPIDDGKGQAPTVLKDNHHGHGKDFIHFTGHLRQSGARILSTSQFNGKKQIGFDDGFFVFAFPVDFSRIK